MKPLMFTVLLAASFVAGQSKQKFTGMITDSMCPTGDPFFYENGADRCGMHPRLRPVPRR